MKKVVIIGAGPAGVTAGLEIVRQSKDYEVVILEQSNDIGGISKTVSHNNNRMDIGGHRFFSKDDRVVKWWAELMPMQGKPSKDDLITGRNVKLENNNVDPEECDKVMLSRRRVSRIYYKKKFFDYPVKMNLNTILNMGLITTFISGLSYLKSIFFKKAETSLENFYINRFGRKLYSCFFEGYTEKLWGRHPRLISADWGAQRVKGLSVIAIIKDIASKIIPHKRKHVETSLIEEFSYPKFGPGQLWETAASEFEKLGGKIIKNAKVVSFENEENSINKVVYEIDGKKVELNSDIVISSMAIKDLICAFNSKPKNVEEIAKGFPYRDFVTVGLSLKKINLKNKTKLKTVNNIIPDCWIYVQDTNVKLGRIQVFNNWSPYMVNDFKNTIWIGLEYFCTKGDDLWNKDNSSWKDFAVDELLKMKVINSKEDVLDYHVEKVEKAYPAYFDTYKNIDDVIDFLNNYNNLYCVGRNGQHRYNNMDHSMATSFVAVDHILGKIKDKNQIWKINTEKEYHEKK